MAETKDILIFIVIGIVIVILYTQFYAEKPFLFLKQEGKMLNAFYYNEKRELIPQIAIVQAIVDDTPNIKYISFGVNVKNTGEKTLRDFEMSGSPQQFDESLAEFSLNELSAGETYVYDTPLIDVDTLPSGDVEFNLEVTASGITKSDSYTINIQQPVCSDGTKFGECSSNKPFYCNENLELIEKASLCGCNEPYQISGEQCTLECTTNENCVLLSSSCIPKSEKRIMMSILPTTSEKGGFGYGIGGGSDLPPAMGVAIPASSDILIGAYHNAYWDRNSPATVTSQTTFDLADYPKGDPNNPNDYAKNINEPKDQSRSEIPITIVNFGKLTTGGNINIKYYHPDGGSPIYQYFKTIPNPNTESWCVWDNCWWDWYTVFAWVGYFDNEINQEGQYTIRIDTWGETMSNGGVERRTIKITDSIPQPPQPIECSGTKTRICEYEDRDVCGYWLECTGSMKPAFDCNSELLVQKCTDYEVGDIIMFKDDFGIDEQLDYIYHRIIRIDKGGINLYWTKGDANEFDDGVGLTIENIMGKVVEIKNPSITGSSDEDCKCENNKCATIPVGFEVSIKQP